MSYITRSEPNSHDTRLQALMEANSKLSTITPANNPLSAPTTARLLAMRALYEQKMNEVSIAKALYNENTPLKNAAKNVCQMFTSHFFQVFNLGVPRGKYNPSHRSFYNLPVDSDALPDLIAEDDIKLWAGRVVTGDNNRLAAGGAAMANPEATEIANAKAAFQITLDSQTMLKDALDNKQEALEAEIEEAENVIRKVWDEMETFYNEEPDESRRANCREWGVVYVTVGSEKKVQGTITLAGTPVAGYRVRFATGRNKGISNAAGVYELKTTLMGDQKVYVDRLDENNRILKYWDFTVSLIENSDLSANFNLIEIEGTEPEV